MRKAGKSLVPIAAVLSIVAIASYAVRAAVGLSTTTAYTQNFDCLGVPATTTTPSTLPTDFKADALSAVRTLGTYATAGTTTARAGGANLSTTAANGIYNFGSGTTTLGGSDRVVGFLASGTATTSGNLYVQLQNTTGGNLSGLNISYNVEKYRNGINPAGFRIQLYYSTDGSTWTNAGSNFLTSFTGDTGTNSGFATAPGVSVPVNNKTLSVPIPSGNLFYLAWNYSVSSGSTVTNAQALAIDDISIQGIAAGNSTNPTGTGSANPSTVLAGNSTLLTVAVTPGANPTSTGLAVSANLSAIGGSLTQQFFDNGTNGDVTAGDNIFSFQATVSAGTSGGSKTLSATITDAQSRGGTASISLNVLAPTSPSGVGSTGSVQTGNNALLTVRVTPGSNPTSTGLGVSADLSSIGGSLTQQFFDDQTHGDATAGDNLYSFQAAVPFGISAGTKTLPATITDAQSRSGSASISLTVQAGALPTTVKISQVYGGGGNSGATYTNDFVEIYNQSLTSPVDLTGWSVQEASGTASNWGVTNLCAAGTTCILAPGHYYLVYESQGAGGTAPLPTADAAGVILMSATTAKVALVADTIPLSGTCPIGGDIVDFVGYGSAGVIGSCSEGTPTAALSNTTAAVRKGNGCVDTNNNLNDFIVSAPIPRNSASPANSCGGDPAQLSGLGIASPAGPEPANITLLTVRVTPATTPAPSMGIAVAADVASLVGTGSPQPQAFYDDGTHGDQTAGDNVFSFQASVPLSAPFGIRNLVATMTDAQGRSAAAPVTVTVASPTCGVELWHKKTGTDANVGLVDLFNPTHTTIANLTNLSLFPAPDALTEIVRATPAETTLWTLNATMTFFKKEPDVDYHIVLQDESHRSLIAEIPSPGCVAASSPFGPGVAAARAKFDSRFTATENFQQVTVPVQVKGVGFFDFLHGQTGVAPNGIELHSVLDINFTANSMTTLLSSLNPSTYLHPVDITVTVSNGGVSTPSGSVTLFDGGVAIATVALDQNGHALFAENLPAGAHPLTVSYGGDSASAASTSTPLTQTVNKADQTIDFGPLSAKTFGDPSFTVSAAPTSGLPATFAIVSGPATIFGNTVTITGAGTVTVRASQTGDDNYNAAPDVDASFEVKKASQTITLPDLSSKTYGDAPFTVSATGGGSGNPVTFSASGNCTSDGVNNSTIMITGGGSCTVTASQAGDADYEAADDRSAGFTINRAGASITVNGYSGVYDGHPHGASGSATGLTAAEDLTSLLTFGETFTDAPGGTAHWTFAGDGNYARAIGDAPITISQAMLQISVAGFTGPYDGQPHGASGGATGLTGEDLRSLLDLGATFTNVPGGTAYWSFAGNTNYTNVSGTASIILTKAAESVTLSSLPDKTYGDAPFVVSATGGGSSSPVTFSASGNCASDGVNGSTITITGAGSCTVTASQAGDSNYDAAPDRSAGFAIARAAARITVSGYSNTYDGAAHGATGSAKGLTDAEDLTNLLNFGATFTDVPGGTAHWTFAGNANYAPASDEAAITISQATLPISVSGYSGPYDGQSHGARLVSGIGNPDLLNLLNLGASFTNVPGGTASWLFAGNTNYSRAFGNADIVINSVTPSFSALSSPVINDAATTVDLSGTISLNALIPTGGVAITLNGVTQNAIVGSDGRFSSSFTPSRVADVPYTVGYSYPGDVNFNQTSGQSTLTVRDTTPPTILAHEDVIAEATSAAGAAVPYSPPGTRDRVDPAGFATCVKAPGEVFPLGATVVTCNASDAHGNRATPTTFTVTVRDTTAPSKPTLTVNPGVLWPPNNQLVTVRVTAIATDPVDRTPACRITNITSTDHDSRDRDIDFKITGPLTASLRAEKPSGASSNKDDKDKGDKNKTDKDEDEDLVYGLTVSCRDAAGNVGLPATINVIVPHDRDKNDR